jgi:N-methylhydantoinase B
VRAPNPVSNFLRARSTPKVVDPIRFEVIRSALNAAVEEVSVALARSAYSTNIKTRLDFSCAFLDKDKKVIVQAFNQPSHLGSLVFSVPRAIEEYGLENIFPGDGILINDSHRGMTHLNDICLISPMYYEDELWGFAANVAHHVDVGGRAPGSIAVSTEIYQEGIIIPGVKILNAGQIDPDVFKLILANVRGKKEFGGDIRAQVAANKLAQRRVLELLARFGADTVRHTISQLYAYTERRSLLAIASFPQGTYRGDAVVDDDGITGDPIRIRAKIVIGEDGLTIDLKGSDGQQKGPMNSTLAQTFSSCAYPVKALMPPDIPVNDGFYRVVRVLAPEGSVVNCSFPSAVVGGWEVGIKTTEAVFRAFAKAMPEKVPAEGKKSMFHIAFGGIDPRDSERYVFLETIAGGYGGRSTKDGPDGVQAHFQNTENSPVEELEVGYPVLIERYELIPDSGGAGRFRGGLGLRRDYRFRDHAATVTILADTAKYPARGMLGGLDGAVARFFLDPDTKEEVALKSKVTIETRPNQVLSMRSPGGGGYGDPRKRDLADVLADVRSGKVSPTAARSIYRVDPASRKRRGSRG